MKSIFSSLVFFTVSCVSFAGSPRATAIVVPTCTGKACTTTNVRSSNGQNAGTATATGSATLYRDASGRIVGTGNSFGGSTNIRDSKGQNLYSIKSK